VASASHHHVCDLFHIQLYIYTLSCPAVGNRLLQPCIDHIWELLSRIIYRTQKKHSIFTATIEPISILSLVGTCLTVGTKAFDVSRGLHDIITALSNSDKDIARLSNQVDLFSCAITQLRAWLAQDPSLSSHLRETLSQSLEHAIIVFLDIEKYVIQVIPKPGEATVGFRRRVRHLWNENAIKEHERMINTQFQAFNLLASLAQL